MPGAPEPNAGAVDAFVAQYSSSGAVSWVHQLGGDGSDVAYGVAVGTDGSASITGWTSSALPGAPEGNGGEYDAFVAHYSAAGTLSWVHELGGTGLELALGVAIDSSGDTYIAGLTADHIPGAPQPSSGNVDAFIAKYGTDGTHISSVELGGTDLVAAGGVTVDSTGRITFVGDTSGHFPAAPEAAAGNYDAIVAQLA
jgi:hypothetical protein